MKLINVFEEWSMGETVERWNRNLMTVSQALDSAGCLLPKSLRPAVVPSARKLGKARELVTFSLNTLASAADELSPIVDQLVDEDDLVCLMVNALFARAKSEFNRALFLNCVLIEFGAGCLVVF